MKSALLGFLLVGAAAFAQDRTLPAGSFEGTSQPETACDVQFKTTKSAAKFCSQYNVGIEALDTNRGVVYRCEGCALSEEPGFPVPRH